MRMAAPSPLAGEDITADRYKLIWVTGIPHGEQEEES